MLPDPERAADARAWLGRAGRDLRAATHGLRGQPPFTDDALFHAQQAAEKSLKGLLAWHDVPFRRTHDLAELGRLCVAIDSDLEDICRRADELTAFAWLFRYPGDAADPTIEEAEAGLALAREVYNTITERLPPEVRP